MMMIKLVALLAMLALCVAPASAGLMARRFRYSAVRSWAPRYYSARPSGWGGRFNVGYATAYSGPFDMDATGKNMCEYNKYALPKRFQVYYAAMNEYDWNKVGGKAGICGLCIRARGLRGQTTRGHKIRPVVVKIVDQCPSWACKKGNVDFCTQALRDITGYGWDKKKIVWEWVSCQTGRPIRRSMNGRSLV